MTNADKEGKMLGTEHSDIDASYFITGFVYGTIGDCENGVECGDKSLKVFGKLKRYRYMSIMHDGNKSY